MPSFFFPAFTCIMPALIADEYFLNKNFMRIIWQMITIFFFFKFPPTCIAQKTLTMERYQGIMVKLQTAV